jgi:UDP-glucose 4-epimerase
MSRILVTGGAGYIGSHTCVELLDAGHEVVIIDDLSNSFDEAVKRIGTITGKTPEFHQASYAERAVLDRILEPGIDAVVHFAGFKAVGESVAKPLDYYRNNVNGTVVLLEAMQDHGVRNLVFSSSCTVYGQPQTVPITEDTALVAESPYGRTKLMIEQILGDLAASQPGWHLCLLRYFNPVGAHASGLIGEDPKGIPNNLMPFIMQVAAGKLPRLQVFGGDYPTRDGTAIRDYIHVVDLARGHIAALDNLDQIDGCEALNLGTGVGTTVLEVVSAVQETIGLEIPHDVVDRRPGDVVAVWADPSKAQQRLGWQTELDMAAMCRDHWRWQSQNPDGYR